MGLSLGSVAADGVYPQLGGTAAGWYGEMSYGGFPAAIWYVCPDDVM